MSSIQIMRFTHRPCKIGSISAQNETHYFDAGSKQGLAWNHSIAKQSEWLVFEDTKDIVVVVNK